jgi:dihydrofolate reductase
MARLVVTTFLTVDGVMQGPGGPDEDRSNGFALGGWSVDHWDEAMGQLITGWTSQAGALLLGRGTYEIFAAHWPNVPNDDPVGSVLNRIPKYVASSTLATLDWRNAVVLEGDVPAAVDRLKDTLEVEIQVHGSPGLLQTLIRHDLVDEYRLWTFPVLLGPASACSTAERSRPASALSTAEASQPASFLPATVALATSDSGRSRSTPEAASRSSGEGTKRAEVVHRRGCRCEPHKSGIPMLM